MSEHTPGPWKLFVGEAGFSIEDANGSKVICQRSPMAVPAELAANGRLIAAAPELYCALYRLVMIADTATEYTPREVQETLDAARALLSRVRS